MDFRKKDMINNINVIMILLMLELLEWSPVIPGFGFQAVCGRSFAERVLWKEFRGKSLRKESSRLRIE